MNTPSIHLVAGGVGAGKTTYALKLADELSAVRFSIDEWMTGLFGPDQQEPIDFAWMIERVRRCEAVIWETAVRTVRAGVPAILDLGLLEAIHRARFIELAKTAGVGLRLHFLDIPAEVRWSRVEQRNQDQGETFRLTVTRQMFDFCEGMLERPGADEMAALEVSFVR